MVWLYQYLSLAQAFIFPYFTFLAIPADMWIFLGQGSNWHPSINPSYGTDNAESLTCCTTKELQLSWMFKEYALFLEVIVLSYPLITSSQLQKYELVQNKNTKNEFPRGSVD